MPFAGITGQGFFSGIFKEFGKNFLQKGLTGAFGGDQQQKGSPQINFPSFSQHKVGMETTSEAGKVSEIETADAIDIHDWNWRLFNPPYQKTQIVIPRITDRLG